MQRSNARPLRLHTSGHLHHWPIFALSLLLAACHTPRADSAAAAQTASPVHSQPSRMESTPAASDIPAATASNAPIHDADGNPYSPDDSYNRANLRPQYKRCVAASDAVTSAIQACMDEEFLWQQERMRAALRIIDASPNGEAKDVIADEQDAYMRDTDRYCRFDPATQGQGQMQDAQSCRINRYANRADTLEALINK